MNKLFFPRIGSYIIITEDIGPVTTPPNQNVILYWSFKQPIPMGMLHNMPNTYSYPIVFLPKASDWYQVGSLQAPRKSWHTWEGHCLIGLRLELSKKDRHFIYNRVQDLARVQAQQAIEANKITGIDYSALHFSIRSRSIALSTKILNDRAVVAPSREEAICYAKKLRGEIDKPIPTRWQRLET